MKQPVKISYVVTADLRTADIVTCAGGLDSLYISVVITCMCLITRFSCCLCGITCLVVPVHRTLSTVT